MTLALVVTVAADQVELASDALWQLGAVAVEERSAGADTELWSSFGDVEDQWAARSATWPDTWRWRFETVDDRLTDTWRDFARPTWIDPQLQIVPAWLPAQPGEDDPQVVSVRIDPGPTFGMGDHPTTVLTLRALRRTLRAGQRVLDVGAGSGVLGICAVLLGAAEAEGIDISPAAPAVAAANAACNGVADRVQVTTTTLADFDGPFDVVLANILAPVLIELSADLRRLSSGGTLVISGVLDGRYDHVVEALAPLRVTEVDTLDGWAAVTLRA